MPRIQKAPLSIDAAVAAVRRDDCGALCVFVGTVRNHHQGKRVRSLSYSSYEEMAEKELQAIETEAKRRWPVGAIHIAHRTGPLQIGDPSVVIAVSSAHRGDAFDACRYAIETLKKTVPIWKEEFYETGKAWISGE